MEHWRRMTHGQMERSRTERGASMQMLHSPSSSSSRRRLFEPLRLTEGGVLDDMALGSGAALDVGPSSARTVQYVCLLFSLACDDVCGVGWEARSCGGALKRKPVGIIPCGIRVPFACLQEMLGAMAAVLDGVVISMTDSPADQKSSPAHKTSTDKTASQENTACPICLELPSSDNVSKLSCGPLSAPRASSNKENSIGDRARSHARAADPRSKIHGRTRIRQIAILPQWKAKTRKTTSDGGGKCTTSLRRGRREVAAAERRTDEERVRSIFSPRENTSPRLAEDGTDRRWDRIQRPTQTVGRRYDATTSTPSSETTERRAAGRSTSSALTSAAVDELRRVAGRQARDQILPFLPLAHHQERRLPPHEVHLRPSLSGGPTRSPLRPCKHCHRDNGPQTGYFTQFHTCSSCSTRAHVEKAALRSLMAMAGVPIVTLGASVIAGCIAVGAAVAAIPAAIAGPPALLYEPVRRRRKKKKNPFAIAAVSGAVVVTIVAAGTCGYDSD